MCFAADVAGNGALGTIATPPAPVPVNVAAPTISGTVVIGQTLTESNGSWSNSPTGYSYQWELCNSSGGACAAIAGATGQTYVITANDAGSTIRVLETASNSSGPGAATSSSQTAVVPAAATSTGTSPATTTSLVAPGLTQLLKKLISSKHHSAKFTFAASGNTTKYQCALVRLPTRKHAKTPAPKFSLCGSSKNYKTLKVGTYRFYVRAVGPGGTGSTTIYRFTIKHS